MIPQAPFVFSIAGLSASFAALAGLVAGLRRGQGLDAIELYRLREIVEAAFVNVLLALALLPMETIAGLEAAIRVAGAAALVYLIGHGLLLERRRRQAGIATIGSRLGVVLVIGVPAIGMAVAAAATGAVWALEILLLLLLARPMAAFLLVLSTFATPARD